MLHRRKTRETLVRNILRHIYSISYYIFSVILSLDDFIRFWRLFSFKFWIIFSPFFACTQILMGHVPEILQNLIYAYRYLTLILSSFRCCPLISALFAPSRCIWKVFITISVLNKHTSIRKTDHNLDYVLLFSKKKVFLKNIIKFRLFHTHNLSSGYFLNSDKQETTDFSVFW